MGREGRAEDVTLAVLNHNGRALLPVILQSIFAQSVQGFSVLLLDDASSDDSIAYVRDRWPQVEVVAAERNMGVSAAMARAADAARTDYVALLNNDLELDRDWLAEMLAALDVHPEAASADGKMLSFHARERLDGAGDVMARNGYPRRRGQGQLDRGQYDAEEEVFSATGGAALFRRAAFEQVGTFDADFGAYYEDVDWGFRARLHGMSARYVPRAVSYHMGSATTGRDPRRYAALLVRNQLIVVLKNFPAALLARHLPRMLLFQLRWLAFDALRGLGGAHVRGLLAAARALPPTLRKRRAIQRDRSASLRELERALS
jgi:GT2 family glycosyltransferase